MSASCSQKILRELSEHTLLDLIFDSRPEHGCKTLINVIASTKVPNQRTENRETEQESSSGADGHQREPGPFDSHHSSKPASQTRYGCTCTNQQYLAVSANLGLVTNCACAAKSSSTEIGTLTRSVCSTRDTSKTASRIGRHLRIRIQTAFVFAARFAPSLSRSVPLRLQQPQRTATVDSVALSAEKNHPIRKLERLGMALLRFSVASFSAGAHCVRDKGSPNKRRARVECARYQHYSTRQGYQDLIATEQQKSPAHKEIARRPFHQSPCPNHGNGSSDHAQ